MTINTEGGLRPSRIEYVPEPSQGVTPDNPAWQSPSDRVTSFEPDGFGPELVEKFAMGDVDPELEAGLEEPSLTVAYDMQKWFVDGNGDPNDIAGYGMVRSANLMGSLTIVERMQSGDMTEGAFIDPKSTVEYRYYASDYEDGTNDPTTIPDRESRVYTVAKGCDVTSTTITGDPSEVDFNVENELAVEHGRSYQIDQPTSGGATLVVSSTDASDTGLSVVIESEGASTSETLQLDSSDATTLVAGSTSFSDIDAIEVQDGNGDPADHAGDILVAVNSGTSTSPTQGDLLAALYGNNFYGNTYGDPGVPTLGTGSHAGGVGTDYFKVGNMGVDRPPGVPFEAAGAVQTIELTVENDTERTPMERSRQQRIHHGTRTVEMAVTIDGEVASHANIKERMAAHEDDMQIAFDRNATHTATITRSVVSEAPRSRSAGENATEQDVTLRGQTATDGGPAITFANVA